MRSLCFVFTLLACLGLPALAQSVSIDLPHCAQTTLAERPQLSGEVIRVEHPRFIVHTTRNGRDAATPYYVEQLAEALNYALDVHERLGWRLPPNDCGEGGDPRLDVYVKDLSDEQAIGYAVKENVVGDNPNTPQVEQYAAYSHLIVENDMEFTTPEQATALIRATIAHELHHNVQFGYDFSESYFGFYEAGAVWMETQIFPQYTDAHVYVPYVFNQPDLCLGSRADERGLRIYGEWLMIDSFTRDLGLDGYERVWEVLALGEGLWAFYDALRQLGTTIESVVERMAIRNLLLDYELAHSFGGQVKVEVRASVPGRTTSRDEGVQQLAVDYVALETGALLDIRLEGPPNLRMTFVGLDRGRGLAYSYDLGQAAVLDTRLYDLGYILVRNTARHLDTSGCAYTPWAIDISPGTGTPTAQPQETWSASKFIPPP
ncbi:MAG: DUF6055 domain-containing protein [Anaerolineae bacterium]|nr:DUF6055 domain-containing protein [Anaerolineae bacterium]MDW8173961.1 DUF6055 domain-containing protein [Anaerolineae bacterium]